MRERRGGENDEFLKELLNVRTVKDKVLQVGCDSVWRVLAKFRRHGGLDFQSKCYLSPTKILENRQDEDGRELPNVFPDYIARK